MDDKLRLLDVALGQGKRKTVYALVAEGERVYIYFQTSEGNTIFETVSDEEAVRMIKKVMEELITPSLFEDEDCGSANCPVHGDQGSEASHRFWNIRET